MRDLVDRHFPDADRIRVVLDNPNTHTTGALTEVAAWETARNEQRATINWQLTVDKARRRLLRLYRS